MSHIGSGSSWGTRPSWGTSHKFLFFWKQIQKWSMWQEDRYTKAGRNGTVLYYEMGFVNCRQFMYLVISLLVLRAGYGIWLYQFLIIAYLFTLHTVVNFMTHQKLTHTFCLCPSPSGRTWWDCFTITSLPDISVSIVQALESKTGSTGLLSRKM